MSKKKHGKSEPKEKVVTEVKPVEEVKSEAPSVEPEEVKTVDLPTPEADSFVSGVDIGAEQVAVAPPVTVEEKKFFKQPEGESCKSCKYFLTDDIGHELEGECHAMPPQPVSVASSSWPILRNNQWCGVYEAR